MDFVRQEQAIQAKLSSYVRVIAREDAAYPPDVGNAVRYIHTHLFDPGLNVASVLDACKIRGGYFFGRFRCHLKMTIRQYIEHCRIEAATRLLCDEAFELTLISHCLGFSYYETFARAFRKCMHCSASEFRMSLHRRCTA